MIRQKGRTDVPPLISIAEFEIHGSLRDLMRQPRHVSEVRLRGLEVKISPGPDDDEATRTRKGRQRPRSRQMLADLQRIIIDRFEAPDTVINLIPRKAGKQPKEFTVHHLVMDSLGINQTIPYMATLTNPMPKGEIETSGTFGPWNVAHPARTPVSGKYVFANANLDTIHGLAGVLSSTGEFHGPLDRIEIEGTTDSPNFQMDVGGQPVPLKTRFTAVVDGSDGDTYLQKVDASFLQTSMTAHGAVIGLEGVPGRRIEVNVDMQNGRIEDLLRLAVQSEKPILLGPARLQAKLVIPPEKKKVIDKMQLRGEFVLSKAKFTDAGVQTKLTGLSRRGQGLNKDEEIGDVLSNLRGRFAMENAVIQFSSLTFSVPGAAVELAGRYGLRDELIDFKGKLKMQATLSQVARRGRQRFLPEGIRRVVQEARFGDGVANQDFGHPESPEVRARYVLVRHRVQHDVDGDRVTFRRKAIEILHVLAFPLPGIGNVGVVRHQHHQPAFVVEDAPRVDYRAVESRALTFRRRCSAIG